jgi:hypothetical protein
VLNPDGTSNWRTIMNLTGMKMFSPFLAGVLLFLTAFGCSSGSDSASNTILFTQTKTLGTEGGQFLSKEYGVSVTFEEGMLVAQSVITLTIFAEQFTGIKRLGYLYSPNGVLLTLDPAALKPSGNIQIEMLHEGKYDSFGTMLAVSGEDGATVALPSQESGPNSVNGTLEQSTLAALFAGTAATPSKDLTIFSANRELEAKPSLFVTSVRPFIDGEFAGVVPDLSGKKVAVLVHGLEADLADLNSLGQFIYDFKKNGESTRYYDVVIGFEYSSNRPLATIGQAMADGMESVGLQDASVVDLIAHSMGNPVSRYAIETTSLPNRIANINHYISLGGPHDGVPFGNLPHTEQTFFYIFKPESEPCLRDLITDGKEGEPQTDFLTNLNLMAGGEPEHGPNFLTTRYYTMSGYHWQLEDPPLGRGVHVIYLASFIKSFGTADGERDDGLVAQYSAQSTFLARQSESWVSNEPFYLSHSELHAAQEAFNQIALWLNN